MACACKGRTTKKFVWTPADSLDGEGSITYPNEIQAKAKVLRMGGTYRLIDPNEALRTTPLDAPA